MARVMLVTAFITFLLPGEPLGPSAAPCGLDPGPYLPGPSLLYTGCPRGT